MDDATRIRFAQTFDRAAELYERVRPGFAAAALDWVLPPPGARVLDLGAGTGKLTTDLVSRGYDVVAIDPSPNMLAQLQAKLPGVEAHLGTAEQIDLAAGSVDAIVAGSAFHWFTRPAADFEMARVLRPGGTVGLLWNQREAASAAMVAIAHAQAHGDENDPSANAEQARLDPALFTAMEGQDFPHVQAVTRTHLVDLVASRSYVIAMGEPERTELLDRVRDAVDTDPELAASDSYDLPYLTLARRCRRR